MNGYKYYVSFVNNNPVLARTGGDGIELYHPNNPGGWGKSSHLTSLDFGEFVMDYDECSPEDAKKYAEMINRNVRSNNAPR